MKLCIVMVMMASDWSFHWERNIPCDKALSFQAAKSDWEKAGYIDVQVIEQRTQEDWRDAGASPAPASTHVGLRGKR